MSDIGQESSLVILLIEDDPHARPALERLLRRAFAATVVSVESGEEALAILETRNDFNVVLSDWDIKGQLNGGDVFKAASLMAPHLIRNYIFLSSNREAEEMCDMFGIQYIEKPGSRATICEAINKVLEAA